MLTEDNSYGNMSDTSPVVQHALTQMDEWLTSLLADKSGDAFRVKLDRAKPADLLDACFTNGGATKIAETQVYTGNTECNQLYPPHSSPRQVAGDSIAMDVLKCQLKPIDTSDYKVPLTSSQLAQLQTIFPSGVCDWSKPGVGQDEPSTTWSLFGS